MNDPPDPDAGLVSVRIRVAPWAAAAAEEFLWTLGPDAVGQVVDGNEADLTATLPAATADSLESRLATFLHEVGLDNAVTVSTTPYREQDWADAHRQEFAPICVRDRLIVAPTWWDAPLPPTAITMRIDPQMAFGTGHHPTTRACLEWLVQRADSLGSAPGGLIDAGCGSGLLAIAAHHLGFTPIVAIDSDPIACTTARRNTATNDAAPVAVVHGDLADVPMPRVPTLVANLTAGAIVRLFPRVAAHVTPAGRIFLAGILVDQEDEVAAAISGHSWRIDERRVTEGWLGLALQRA